MAQSCETRTRLTTNNYELQIIKADLPKDEAKNLWNAAVRAILNSVQTKKRYSVEKKNDAVELVSGKELKSLLARELNTAQEETEELVSARIRYYTRSTTRVSFGINVNLF